MSGFAVLLMVLGCGGASDSETGGAGTDSKAGSDSDALDSAEDTSNSVVDVDWDPACHPFSVGNDCLSPFPSLAHFEADASSSTGLRLNLANEDFLSPDGELPLDLSLFNLADGVSPVSPYLVNLGVDVDEAFLSGWGEQGETVTAGAPIALVHLETGERVPLLTEMDQANRDQEVYDDRHALILRPLAPLEFGARYAAVLTTALTDVDGAPLPESSVFAVLRDGQKTSDPAIEAMRPEMDALFGVLEVAGWARESVHLAWEIPVSSEDLTLGPIRSMREQGLAEIEKNGVPYTIDSVEIDPSENVGWRVEGTFQPPNFLSEDNRIVLDSTGFVTLQEDGASYPFTLVVPPVAREHGGMELVLVGHGLFGTGNSMLAGSAAEVFASRGTENGSVFVATDWIGLSASDYSLIVGEVLEDLSGVRVITDRLVQSHVNQLALVELVLGELLTDPTFDVSHDEPLVVEDPVHYYGISLGGIQGASQVSLSHRIDNAVLAVPGAGWANLMQRSTQFEPFEQVIDVLYPDPLSQLLFITAMQTFFDWSDPGVLGALLSEDPDKVVLLQEAIGDCQVANITTDLLARRLGARHLEEATDPVYGLETVSGPTGGVVLTQIRVPDALENYFPPDENTTPEKDNGVHNSAVLQEATLDQAQILYQTGQAVHPCDGPCDPD